MVDLHPASTKLRARATRIVRQLTGLDEVAAQTLLERAGSAKVAIVMHHRKVTPTRAQALLEQAGGRLREVIGNVRGAAAKRDGRRTAVKGEGRGPRRSPPGRSPGRSHGRPHGRSHDR
jgi:hypothetical protein